MKLNFLLFLISIIGIDLIAQPLAPRNRTRKKQLIEIFSGVRCGLCVLSDIEIAGPIDCPFSVINYHAGIFSLPKIPSSPDLRTICGTAIHDSLKVSKYPFGIYNRVSSGGFNVWNNFKNQNEIGDVNIGMEVLFDSATRKNKIRVEVFSFPEYKDSVIYLQVFLVEDSVIAEQIRLDSTWIDDYRHHHVFRFPISSCFGDSLYKIKSMEPKEKSYEIKIPDSIKIKDAKIVAFITSPSGEVLNSETFSCLGGRTSVPIVFIDERSEEIIFEQAKDFDDTLYLASYIPDSISVCIILEKSRQNWNTTISSSGNISDDTLIMKLPGNSTTPIFFHLDQLKKLQYGKVRIKVLINCKENVCGTFYEKNYTFHHKQKVLVIINTAENRNPNIPLVDLTSPVTDVLDKFSCDNYAVEKDYNFKEIYYLREKHKINTHSIYYSTGWGIPPIPDSTHEYLKKLIANGTNLMMQGQDFAYAFTRLNTPMGARTWMGEYGVYNVNDGDSTTTSITIDTRDTIFGKVGGTTFNNIYASSTSSNTSIDAITGDPAIVPRVMFGNRRFLNGTYRDLGHAKLVFFCAGMEMIATDSFRNNFITRIHRWFGACNSFLDVEENKFNKGNEVFNVYSTGNTLFFQNLHKEKIQKIILYNIFGVKISEHPVSSNSIIQLNSNLNGIFIVSIIPLNSRQKIYSQKIVINSN